MIEIEINLVGYLRVCKDLKIKPNFSELERIYGIDRHKISRMYTNNGEIKRKEHVSLSKWDKHYDEIVLRMNQVGATKIGVYKALEYIYGNQLPGTYSGFKTYTLRKGITLKKNEIPHVLYETDPGEQLQVDWKENLSIELTDGSIIDSNVFSATLGYSREHVFIYSTSKTTDDFIRCIIEVFRKLGGTTKKVKTDNMSAIVTCKGNNKKIIPKISQFFKDMDVTLELCRIRTPETKGKDENSNKFINRLKSMNNLFATEDELIHYIEETLTSESNAQINSGTQISPCLLFKKEKEYLRPVPNEVLLESYIREHKRYKIESTLLFRWEKNRYSVPALCLGKFVDVYRIEDSLYVYMNSQLVAKHNISQYPVNYDKSHYMQALSMNLKRTEDIEDMAVQNIERLKGLKR